MPSSSSTTNSDEANSVFKKCRKLWRRFRRQRSCITTQRSDEEVSPVGQRYLRHGDEQNRLQSGPKTSLQPTQPRRRLPVELLTELCDCVPHHRLGLAKLVTSYSSCPVGLFGVHLTAQNGAPSTQMFHICSLITKLLEERREKMVGPITKWNDNELEMYNKWKAESVHLITLLEEVKRLHASQ